MLTQGSTDNVHRMSRVAPAHEVIRLTDEEDSDSALWWDMQAKGMGMAIVMRQISMDGGSYRWQCALNESAVCCESRTCAHQDATSRAAPSLDL